MHNQKCRFVSIAIAAIAPPTVFPNTRPTITQLTALGLLIAERDENGTWWFELKHHATAPGQSEDDLLAWATHALPDDGIVLGWKLADEVLPPLLDAGVAGDPEIGRAFLERLMHLVTAPSVDLALPYGGAAALPLNVVAAVQGIPLSVMTPGEIETAWAFGNLDLLRRQVEALAVANWQLWLADANGAATAASKAFAEWQAR